MAIAFEPANYMNAGRVGHVEAACRLDNCHPISNNHLNELAPVVFECSGAERALFKALTL